MIIWAGIPEFNGLYDASNTGLIRRNDSFIKHNLGGQKFWKGHIMRPRIVKGYYRATLSINGNTKGYYVHRLVALAFIPNPKNKPCVNHIDGNTLNNHSSNLEWCTWSENTTHAFATGLLKTAYGEAHYSTKLTRADIVAIRAFNEAGITQKDISKRYGVDASTISRIINKHNWKCQS